MEKVKGYWVCHNTRIQLHGRLKAQKKISEIQKKYRASTYTVELTF